MQEIWVQTDEAEDVAGSIRQVIRVAQFVSEDPQTWKWIALALHSALQGACICHLTTTAQPLGAVTKRNSEEWLKYWEASRTNPNKPPPKTFLMNLPDLLKAARKPNSAGDGGNFVGLTINESELKWLRRFHNEIRNQFTHFEPKSWSIEVSGIPEIAKLVAGIIQEILEYGWAFRHQSTAQCEELKRSLQALKRIEWSA